MKRLLVGIVLLSLLLVACGEPGTEYFNTPNSFHIAKFGKLTCASQGLEYKTWRYYVDPVSGEQDDDLATIVCQNKSVSVYDGVVVRE